MLTAEKKKKYTVDDYLQLEEGAPFQLINYELIMSPSPNSLHQRTVARLTQIFLNFLDSQNINGYVAGSMDVVFDDGNVYQPDLLYVSAEREDEIVKDRVYGPPDLAIEILSPSNAYYDLRYKKKIYGQYGVKEYIIIDPIGKNAELYTLKEGVYVLDQDVQITGSIKSVILPGLIFQMEQFLR